MKYIKMNTLFKIVLLRSSILTLRYEEMGWMAWTTSFHTTRFY